MKSSEVTEIWETRYSKGQDSGTGSYGDNYIFKRDVIKDIIEKYGIESIVDFGCGDGHQISELDVSKYVGYDISRTVVDLCNKKYLNDETKSFHLIDRYLLEDFDLAMSLDVIYHIINHNDFIEHLNLLFSPHHKYVVVFSTNHDQEQTILHILHRNFTKYVEENTNFELVEIIENDLESADFYIYKRK